ncbi:MAG TPA: phenylalanine--tRNA ligase subunit alpha [Candidatus Faecalibacterium avium]|uniref:phenylalanine--tRNA ligase subunit alpha n=1 Tax=Faecalibacterium sp. An121 TaxID=1965550 RepID=UPI000B37B7DB|nr:phenylalanine--tRNA ligase subunit alpha [Faecalibacterium sp. An121]OUQ40967.1 phenylalanine--tRNA ligase subunit alpha [Faecalibacterium sp. An121]HIV43757.1 phenylalanine--tRNA ligase subunit alpha [Candidatus Faecalibacterium avium]
MQAIIDELAKQAQADLAQVSSKETLAAFWQKYLSKNGQIPALMKDLRTVAPADRPAMGKAVNQLKQKVQADYDQAAARVNQLELAARNAAETVDITLPAKVRPTGGLHPLTLVRNQIIDAFAGMGFEIYEGPEIEDDDHCFTRLNVPKDHPARDMQDTFYLSDELLLRTQTSTGQIRTMDAEKPPIKVLVPGRVFRSDSDATHSPMFHQMEGLVVDKGITLCDLQGMLDVFVQRLFGSEVRTRLRPSYFPFTEPSVEVDVSCFACHGKGCSLCKHTGWIEILGGGVVNQKVLRNCNIDPEVYSGIAFGIGIERIAMLKYGINNIGLMFENDLRFLGQFHE